MIFVLLALNFVISWFNAWGCGKAWAETRQRGGWPRFMNWMGAIMSASGFTWCYLLVIGMVAYGTGYLDEHYLEAFYSLGYLIIIFPIIGSGLAILVDSWAYFLRRRTFGSGAVAGWNSFAQIYNTMSAIKAVPDAFGKVVDAFTSDKDSKNASGLVVVLVLLAVVGGILTTSMIIRSTAKKHALSMKYKYAEFWEQKKRSA